ncbi:MAG: pantothenate kinase [Myxococcales bacterium]|jgi:type III pantothenate kinase|nr:pantothenate kinase [Myxococcales bacterium]|tara:strand:+ start:1003 stop:1782 length:780 start_codon:yes stop_codon:yes gene_type:complete
MILLVDIGNTQTVYGVHDGTCLQQSWRQATDSRRTVDEHRAFLRPIFEDAEIHPRSVRGICIASVVPEALGAAQQALEMLTRCSAMVVGPGLKTGVPIRVDNPREVGADRIVNVAGAWNRHRCALIVVDFGTATTFDVIDRDGAYRGGAIAPGLQTSLDALVRRTAKLRQVEICAPPQVTGRTTEQAMQSGLFYGYAGLVEGLVQQLKNENPEVERVLATGGLASTLHPVVPAIHEVVEDLTLHGLWCIYNRNEHEIND